MKEFLKHLQTNYPIPYYGSRRYSVSWNKEKDVLELEFAIYDLLGMHSYQIEIDSERLRTEPILLAEEIAVKIFSTLDSCKVYTERNSIDNQNEK